MIHVFAYRAIVMVLTYMKGSCVMTAHNICIQELYIININKTMKLHMIKVFLTTDIMQRYGRNVSQLY